MMALGTVKSVSETWFPMISCTVGVIVSQDWIILASTTLGAFHEEHCCLRGQAASKRFLYFPRRNIGAIKFDKT